MKPSKNLDPLSLLLLQSLVLRRGSMMMAITLQDCHYKAKRGGRITPILHIADLTALMILLLPA